MKAGASVLRDHAIGVDFLERARCVVDDDVATSCERGGRHFLTLGVRRAELRRVEPVYARIVLEEGISRRDDSATACGDDARQCALAGT